MPLLATLIKALFVGLIGVFSQWVTKRLAISLAVAAVFVSLSLALLGTMEAVVSGVLVPMPSWLGQAICWWMPSNFAGCVSVMIGAQATRWAYDLHVKQIQMKWAM